MLTDKCETLNVTDAAARLGVTRYTLLNMALLGRVGYVATVDSKIRFNKRGIETRLLAQPRPDPRRAIPLAPCLGIRAPWQGRDIVTNVYSGPLRRG